MFSTTTRVHSRVAYSRSCYSGSCILTNFDERRISALNVSYLIWDKNNRMKVVSDTFICWMIYFISTYSKMQCICRYLSDVFHLRPNRDKYSIVCRYINIYTVYIYIFFFIQYFHYSTSTVNRPRLHYSTVKFPHFRWKNQLITFFLLFIFRLFTLWLHSAMPHLYLQYSIFHLLFA